LISPFATGIERVAKYFYIAGGNGAFLLKTAFADGACNHPGINTLGRYYQCR